jgi:hypothetical protein
LRRGKKGLDFYHFVHQNREILSFEGTEASQGGFSVAEIISGSNRPEFVGSGPAVCEQYIPPSLSAHGGKRGHASSSKELAVDGEQHSGVVAAHGVLLRVGRRGGGRTSSFAERRII